MKKFSYLAFAFLLLGAGCSIQDDVEVGEVVDEIGMPAPDGMPVDEMIVEDEDTEDEDDEDGDDGLSITDDVTNIVNMKTGNFFFEPASITAKAGEEVRLVFAENSGMHDFVIDEIDVKISVKAGEAATFTAPTEPGTYAFYCSIGSHRAMGMEGVLIVE